MTELGVEGGVGQDVDMAPYVRSAGCPMEYRTMRAVERIRFVQ